jgi:hypothetical protein
MVAPEGTPHNSSLPRRWLREISFSQASSLRIITAWMRVGPHAATVFVLSSVSQPRLISSWESPHLNKRPHSLGCGGLAWLQVRALGLANPIALSTTLRVWGLVLTVSSGAVIELHQAFRPGRMMSLPDVFVNAAGSSVVASMWPRMGRRRPILLC